MPFEFIAPAVAAPAPACCRRDGGEVTCWMPRAVATSTAGERRSKRGGSRADWEDFGRLKRSLWVLGLPPASRRGGISGARGQPLQGRGSHAVGVHRRSLVCSRQRGEMGQARGFQINPLRARCPHGPAGGDPAQSLLPAPRAQSRQRPPPPQSGGRGRARTSSHIAPKIDLINHRN